MLRILFAILLLVGSNGSLSAQNLFTWLLPKNKEPPPAPFQLTSEEENWLDQFLKDWENERQKIKTFKCNFKRWQYYPDLARSKAEEKEPAHVDYGIINFASPNKVKYQVLYTYPADGKREREPIEENRKELYICDGKAFYWYTHNVKRLDEYQLPPNFQLKDFDKTSGCFFFHFHFPLVPFLCKEAKDLQQSCYIRLVTPADVKNQIWIVAYPRSQEEAANYHYTIMILETPKLTPMALKTVFPGGKNYVSYQFYDVKINDPHKDTEKNPFQADTPRGWQKEIHPAQSVSALKPPPGKR
jgi:TIGR03009 family protein